MIINQEEKNFSDPMILLFDGICILCYGLVKFIIKRDKRNKFRFVSLQSTKGKAILQQLGLMPNEQNTVILVIGMKYYIKSAAVLTVLYELGGLWKLFYPLIFLPKSMRDFVYGIIAKHRFRLFGKMNSCVVPTPEIQDKFL